MSGDEIHLDTNKGIAQLVFERVEKPVSKTYSGAFSDEFDYRGMGEYSTRYEKDMRKLEQKADEIAGIEKRMYGNVLEIMAIFAAIFSLVNINLCGALAEASAVQVIVLNLVTIGSFAVLAALIMTVLKPKERYILVTPWVVAVLAFAAAIALASCLM